MTDRVRRNSRGGNWLWLVLVASILLNAFWLGWWSMGHLAPRNHTPGHDGLKRLEHAAAHVDPQYRARVRQLISDQDKVVQRESDALLGIFTQVNGVLTAPQFDAAKLDALHSQMDDHDRALKDSFSQTAKEIAQTLPDGERIKFFNAACPPPPPDAKK